MQILAHVPIITSINQLQDSKQEKKSKLRLKKALKVKILSYWRTHGFWDDHGFGRNTQIKTQTFIGLYSTESDHQLILKRTQ